MAGWPMSRGRVKPMRAVFIRASLATFLVVATALLGYSALRNERTVRSLADLSLESTALSLSSAVEKSWRADGPGSFPAVRAILSDRVVAYAVVVGDDGTVRFHTNVSMIGRLLPEQEWTAIVGVARPVGGRLTLGTGLSAYRFDYPLHRPDGGSDHLRLVLHATPADAVLDGARAVRWSAAVAIILLWIVGIALDRSFSRFVRLAEESDRRERLALVGQMTASLAHEIRNAVGGVKGFAQWIAEKTETSDPRKAGAVAVVAGVARIEALVGGLLRFAKPEACERKVAHPGPVVEDAVRDAVSEWRGKVDVSVSEGAMAVFDPEKLRSVVVDAVRNAVEAMGSEGLLTATVDVEGRWVEVRIADTGPGLSGVDAERLFTPFYTTKASGTGLGLASAKKAVDAMDGEIDLRDRPTGGAVLLIRLPKGG